MNDPLGALSVSFSELSPRHFLVKLAGEMDLASAGELRTRLDGLPPASRFGVVVDLSALSFVDSSGLNGLVEAARAVEAGGGCLAFGGASPNISRLFAMVRLDDVVSVEATVDEALANVRARVGVEGA